MTARRQGWRRLIRRSVSDAVAAELDFHLAMRAHELAQRGVDPVDARRQAEARFTNFNAIGDECRRIGANTERTMRRTEYLREFVEDARFALRQLRKAPLFTVTAIVTLALGIAATTVIFAAVDAVLLRRFSYADPASVMMVTERMSMGDGNVSVGNYVDWAAMARSFTTMGAENFRNFNLATTAAPERLFGGLVTASYFRVFGVAPIMGRVFTDDEDQSGRDGVVVLSEPLWRARYNANPAVVGTTLLLDGQRRTVIGVMPASFDPSVSGEQFWVPAAFTAANRAMHDDHFLNVYGRLKPGVSIAQAQAEMTSVMAREAERYPKDDGGRGSRVQSLAGTITADYRAPLLLLQAAVVLVLLIACGNVANMQLARSAARAREMAIRAAIGAGFGRIVRQLVAESVVLGAAACAAGLVAAQLGLRLLVANAPDGVPRLTESRITAGVACFAIGAAVVSALIAGLVPALRVAHRDPQQSLRGGGRQSGAALRDRVRSLLIVAEVALAIPVLTGAGLLLRSAQHLQQLDPGFALSDVLTARIILPAGATTPQNILTAQRIVAGVATRPGVVAAGITSQAPMGPGEVSNGLLIEGKPFSPEALINARLRLATPGYLDALKLRLKRGRFITAADVADAPRVMVISETLARQLWPGADPIGKRVGCCEAGPDGPRYKTVVGVVGDVRAGGPAAAIEPEFYLPLAQAPDAAWGWLENTVTLAVRGPHGAAATLTGAIRAAVRDVDPTIATYQFGTLDAALRSSVAVEHFNTVLLTSLGVIGLLLAAVGVYGVIGYFVALRTHEIGIRMALGATAGDVVRLLTLQGMTPVAGGMAIGAALAFWGALLLRHSLYGVAPHDPVTLAAVVAVIGLSALVATVIPATRATRVEPTQALRGE